MPGGFAVRQQVGLPDLEHGQVAGQGGPGGLHVGGGLLQGQRQPTQLDSKRPGPRTIRVAGTVHQEICRDPRIENRDLQGLAGGPVLILRSNQHLPGPGRRHEGLHRRAVRRVVEHHQPAGFLTGQHRVHRGHRIARVRQLPRAELGGQHRELRSEDRRILGGELPAHRDLGQMPVRVLHRHAGLARPAKPAQRHQPRPRPSLRAGQPGVQLREQPLPARQEDRPWGEPHRLAGHLRPSLVFKRSDGRTAPVGSHRSGAQIPCPGRGYWFAGPGGIGFGGATFPWITPAAAPPPHAVMVTSRPAATD